MALSSQWTQSYKAIPDRVGFLDLPRELRDLVYEYAFQVSGAIFIYSSDPYHIRPKIKARIVRDKNEGPTEPQPIDSVISIALMKTCRQVHAECCGVLYGRNVFRLYMSNADFAPAYHALVRHITFTTDADHRIYGDDLETVGYWWRRRFWPATVEKSMKLLQSFPGLETLIFPIKSNRHGQTWRPAFLASDHKTREQRIALAAAWLKLRCPIENEQLRQCLHLEIVPASDRSKAEYEGSSFSPEDEWDCSEFAEAFERTRALPGSSPLPTHDLIMYGIGFGALQVANAMAHGERGK